MVANYIRYLNVAVFGFQRVVLPEPPNGLASFANCF